MYTISVKNLEQISNELCNYSLIFNIFLLVSYWKAYKLLAYGLTFNYYMLTFLSNYLRCRNDFFFVSHSRAPKKWRK